MSDDTRLTPENIEAVAIGLGATDYAGHQAAYRKAAVDAILKARRIDAQATAAKALETLLAQLAGKEADHD